MASTLGGVVRRFLFAAAVLALVTTASPAGARTSKAVASRKLIMVVKKNLPPATEKQLAVLVLVTQNGGPAGGAVATSSKPLTVLLGNRGMYRVKAAIDSACKGTCAGSYRISGSTNHKLEVVPSCQPRGSGFVCSKVRIVKIY
jgi:hypothetical protein